MAEQHFFLGVVPDAPRCPHCGTDLVDGPIPFERRDYYAPPYLYLRSLIRIWNDVAQETHCPDCGGTW